MKIEKDEILFKINELVEKKINLFGQNDKLFINRVYNKGLYK